MKSYFYSPRKTKLILAQCGPRVETARGEEARAHWHSCKNTLALSENSANTTRTIFIDNDFATKPSDLLLFIMARPSTIPTHAGTASGGTGAYAGYTGHTLIFLRG